jgi:surfeit locus 1 family protein
MNLGLWQLRRNHERRLDNQVHAARMTEPATDIEDLVTGAGADVESLEYRRVSAHGTFRPDLEILVRNMTNDGVAGFHVLTPFQLDDGNVVIVNRGWVPLAMDTPPVAAAPPRGEVGVTGLVRLTQNRPRFGPIDGPGGLSVVSRVDLDKLSLQLPGHLVPVWVMADGPKDQLPVPVPVPVVDDPGPHLGYAFQWFSFTVTGLVGYAALIRQHTRRARQRRRNSVPV